MVHAHRTPDPMDFRPLDRSEELQAFYQDRSVVDSYLKRRTAQPLNSVLHRGQVAFLNRVIAERRPRRILEIAPGPARLTAELDFAGVGMAVDASPQMLAVARARLAGRPGEWSVARGDAFQLPVASQSVDLVYTTKFIRHFQRDDRARLYGEVRRVLRRGGAFVMDAQNRAISQPHREKKGLERYPIYDVLYALPELIDELRAERFAVLRVEGLVKHFALQLRLNRLRRIGLARVARALVRAIERVPGGSPSTWMVLCEIGA
jgi:ubiquinone/menaquinone biosynthesis C-methylase UbiE